MGTDSYRVQVLYYLNPHLIWVEVLRNYEEILFEQVGIYGVLPLDTTIDFEGTLKSYRCEEWAPAAIVLMKNIICDAEEVWFRPTYIDRRSSIFDDNIHKYGDLIIKKPSGKPKSLTKYLSKSGFAFHDECVFHQELSLGKIKTKLDSGKIKEVIKHLEGFYSNIEGSRKWEQSVKKQMTVFQMGNVLETKLTRRNLDKFTRENYEVVLQNKKQDFEMCKDVDEVSSGRACSKRNQKEALTSKLQKKKLEQVKQSNDDCEVSIFKATKKLLDSVCTTRNGQNNGIVDNSAEIYQELSSESIVRNLDKDTNAFKEGSPKAIQDSTISSPVPSAANRFEVAITNHKTGKKYTHKKQIKVKVPEYEPEKEKRVAYGPPDLNKMKLPTKIIPKLIINENINVKPDEIIEDDVEEIAKRDMFADIDSNIDIVINNVDILKSIHENADKKKEMASSKLIKKADQLNSVVKKNNIDTPKALYGRKDKNDKIKAVDERSDNLDKKCDAESTKTDFNVKIDVKSTGSTPITVTPGSKKSLLLQRQLKLHKAMVEKKHDSSTSSSDTTNKDTSSSEVIKPNKKDFKEQLDSDDDTVSGIVEKMKANNKSIAPMQESVATNNLTNEVSLKNNVNPFRNIDGSASIFVEKLVSPVLMVHTKKDSRIQPRCNLRDLPFGTNIQVALKNMNIKEPTRLQTVTWASILRGYSVFTISPLGSGKTMGYLPAVCRLVSDSHKNKDCVGPSCIIVCATVKAVSDIERQAKMFLGLEETVLACYAGMDDLTIATSLLNGCDLLISTPLVLIKLMQNEFGVDIRRLTTLVLDDCERLSEVYATEIKVIFFLIKEMLKNRANKELKVQLVVASRIWCDFMRPLALKAPDTLICIGAFQECVLYSKANTTVNYVKKENKINAVTEFLKQIDGTKKTVIVCRSDVEVELLLKTLTKLKYVVLACNSTMTVHDLYNINVTLGEYQEPVLGPILLCCDDNLTHLNVTDANYLLHYSMPQLFSMFCKRFSVLNDKYGSVFKTDNEIVKINILLEESNVEQLPKILNFVKRCSYKVPEALDNVGKQVLAEKDLVKAKCFVPVCDNLLALGECPDFWNCEERHAVVKEFDEPNEWVPKTGVITFKILHYHTAVLYSARLLSSVVKGITKKFPQTYSSLSLRMGIYFSKESNKQLHGIPTVGDVCAVSLKQNFFTRCQVLKILNRYQTGNPNYVLIKLIDEEKYEKSRDVYLYHLPDELKEVETHVVQVRLANTQPQDRDVTFSDLAMQNLKRITDKDEEIYMRGKVVLTVGNCIFVDTLEACQDLSSLNETVVKHNFKKDLLDTHALPNGDHITILKKLAKEIVASISDEKEDYSLEVTPPLKHMPEVRWAHLDTDEFSSVFFTTAESPDHFFVRLTKFEDCINVLVNDINHYVKDNPERVKHVKKGDIVLAMFPDDSTFERARIDEVIDENKVKCFFVDQGDWRDVAIKDLVEITDAFVTKIPFQAIECRLIGLKPAGDDWTEFSINWLYDKCFEGVGLKYLFIKYFTKEKAESTGGYKYGVVLIDTYTNEDVIINKLIIDVNFAQKDEEEYDYINRLDFKREVAKTPDSSADVPEGHESKFVVPYNCNNNNIPQQKPLSNANYDHNYNISDSESECDVNMDDNLLAMARPLLSSLCQQFNKNTPQITADEFNERLNGRSRENIKVEELIDAKPKALESKKEESPIKKPKDLDSDDLTTPDGSEVSRPLPPNVTLVKDELRKPKLLWRQNKSTVTLRILLIGVDRYEIVIDDRSLQFNAVSNDTNYGFEFELYGVIDTKKSTHSNRGQYIIISLCKVMKRNWLTLTKDGGIRKWIVYDIDSIDTSSDEEVAVHDSYINTLKHIHNKIDTDSEDDDFIDDANFSYRK